MPRIDDNLLNCAFYLYQNRKSAQEGEKIGGTGFIAGISYGAENPEFRRTGSVHLYAITNAHVIQSGNSVIRINGANGGSHIVELDPIDWDVHLCGDDLAVTPLSLNENAVQISYFNETLFVQQDQFNERDGFGVGDDVVMIGRFPAYEGVLMNEPSARFGNISFIPREKIPQGGRNFAQESICLDMRSVSGYSGSPVFAYRRHIGSGKIGSGVPFGFIGVHWGSMKDTDKVEHAGITCIVPSWKVWDLLMTEKLKEQRKLAEQYYESSVKPG